MKITLMPSFLSAPKRREDTPGTPDIPEPSTLINDMFFTTEKALTPSLLDFFPSLVTKVPSSSGSPQYLRDNGTPASSAGIKEWGWTTGAPKNESSVASAYVISLIRWALGTSFLLAEYNRLLWFQYVRGAERWAATRAEEYSPQPSSVLSFPAASLSSTQ